MIKLLRRYMHLDKYLIAKSTLYKTKEINNFLYELKYKKLKFPIKMISSDKVV